MCKHKYLDTARLIENDVKSFAEFNLPSSLKKACDVLGYFRPTPIQSALIPLALRGRDICGCASTGSGKTAAYSIPLISRNILNDDTLPNCNLIITPTRELSLQVQSMVSKLAQFTNIRVALVIGGISIDHQKIHIKSAPEFVVATPGRLVDLINQEFSAGLAHLNTLVLDEADKLLEMGFIDEINEIVRICSIKRQTILLSATMTEEINKLTVFCLKEPVRLVAKTSSMVPNLLTQEILRLKGLQNDATKVAILLALCARKINHCRTIIFFRTKHRVHRMKILFCLAKLPIAAELHGDMTQTQRLKSLDMFRKGDATFLLSTDLASRGLDFPKVKLVINFDAPLQFKTYIHRIGRTARAGRCGRAITIIEDCARDRAIFKQIAKQQNSTNVLSCIVPPKQVLNFQRTLDSVRLEFYGIIAKERKQIL